MEFYLIMKYICNIQTAITYITWVEAIGFWVRTDKSFLENESKKNHKE